MQDPNYLLLEGTAEAMMKDLTDRLNNEWHGKPAYDRLRYRIDRLEEFRDFLRLKRQFNP